MKLRKDIMNYAASMKNPPKGYGSISAGLEVAKYRSDRMKYWKEQIGNGSYTDEVFERADDDVISEFGQPF
jgi:hypothetical protein